MLHYFEPIDSRLINQARKIVYIIDDNLFKKNYFVENSDKILFIGHGYGQNSENLSIDNNLKSTIESYSVTNNFKNIVFLGDFLTTSKNKNWRDFNKQISNLEKEFLVLGNHEYSLTSYIRLFFNFQSSYFKIVDDKNNVFYFLNTIRKCSDINTVRKQLNRNFTLKTSYQREYYQFKDNFRITFDSKIEFGKLSSSGNLLKKFVKKNFHIIEFKGEEKNYTNDQYLISQIMKDFMSLNGKFSKYIYGIDSIYNSNLFK